MAKRIESAVIMPEAGAAFAFPIGGGRFAACRVILGANSERAKRWGSETKIVLVAGSAWIGDAVPSAEDPALRTILYLTHHAWADFWTKRPNMFWTPHAVPAKYIPIGNIAPTAEEERITCDSISTWETSVCQALLQWRWDHERDAVLAEDAIKAKKAAETRQRQQRKRENYLNSVTLAGLREHKFFADWTYPSVEARSACQRIMKGTVERLLAIGANSSEAERMHVLQECIESFNELDAQLEFIETEEREDICEEFQAVAYACGLGHNAPLADKWRNW